MRDVLLLYLLVYAASMYSTPQPTPPNLQREGSRYAMQILRYIYQILMIYNDLVHLTI